MAEELENPRSPENTVPSANAADRPVEASSTAENDASRPGDASGDWRRVHPLTPVLRFWLTLLIGGYFVFREAIEDTLSGQHESDWIRDVPSAVADAGPRFWLIGGGIVLLLFGAMFWSWWFTRFRIEPETVRVREGAVFRTDREARLDRVQSIEITQTFLARLLGMGELVFDVAEAGESVVRLRFLRKKEAERLRTMLLRRRREVRAEHRDAEARTDEAGTPDAGEFATLPGASAEPDAVSSEETPLVHLSAGRAVGATLLTGDTVWILSLTTVYLIVLLVIGELQLWPSMIVPLALGFGGTIWSRLNTTAHFRVYAEPDALRTRSGLTSTAQHTIPRGRIQAVGISQPLLWRIPGWFRITVNVAGGRNNKDDEPGSRNVLLPAGTGQEVMDVLPYVLERPVPGDLDGRQMKAALEGTGAAYGFTAAPRRARWLDPLGWRRNGYADAGQYLFLRRGRLRRVLVAVPHERTQSAAIHDGPLRRRLGLASAELHSVGGPVHARVPHLALDDARRLVREQAARAAAARGRDHHSPAASVDQGERLDHPDQSTPGSHPEPRPAPQPSQDPAHPTTLHGDDA